jgi:hypothetical protein
MARLSDNISTFLETVKQQPSPQQSQQQTATRGPVAGTSVQRILNVLANHPGGIEIGALYKETSLDFSQFAEAMEKLKKLSGVRVSKDATGEIAVPGENVDAVASILNSL